MLAALALILALILPPCPTEDSTMCTWDATQHGNGQGHSIVNLWEGVTVFLP